MFLMTNENSEKIKIIANHSTEARQIAKTLEESMEKKMNDSEIQIKLYDVCEKINKIENEMHRYDDVVRRLKELNKDLKKVYEEYSQLKIEAKKSGHTDWILVPNKHFLNPPEFLEL